MSKRADAVRRVRGWLTRGALVAAWALVGWGTLLLLSTVVGLVRDGPGTAVGRLLPRPDAGPWAYLNSASVALALAAWFVLAGLWVRARRETEPDSTDTSER